MDKYFIDHPIAGVLQMKSMLTLQGYTINHKRVRRLLRKMGLTAIYPQKNLSLGGCSKYFHPYLLRNIEITYPNQVWSTDISYIPMKEGFMYLYAIIDVYSRFIVGWKLSNTLSASNCYKLVEDCIKLYGAPKIINSDQGSQYTTKNCEELLIKNISTLIHLTQ